MTEHEELKREVKQKMAEMEETMKSVGSSKKKALKILVKAGICTPKGKLTARYR